MQPELADKVHNLYLRGDYETAVFQAFKMVEVAVRRVGGFDNSMYGRDLMMAAFREAPDPSKSKGTELPAGPLTDTTALRGEQDSMKFLFSGAIGHAKNPPSHRDVRHNRQTAARLIVFASHLLEIVAIRALFV